MKTVINGSTFTLLTIPEQGVAEAECDGVTWKLKKINNSAIGPFMLLVRKDVRPS